MAQARLPFAKYQTVAIIGTAGRGDDASKMTKELFQRMCQSAIGVLTSEWKLDLARVKLQSGGAAWADHVAVQLCNDLKIPITLHLPCQMDEKNKRAMDTGVADWKANPGRVMNAYHKQFTLKMGYDTLAELCGLPSKIYSGFHKRNDAVANSDYVLAFTWGEGNVPKDGGTKYTWDKATTAKRKHIPLSTL